MDLDAILGAIRAQTRPIMPPATADVLPDDGEEEIPPCEAVAASTEQSAEAAPLSSLPVGATPNPGMLMTLGARYGYPSLPLKRGEALAEGYTAWRTFTRTARPDMLWLADLTARAAWPADPMVGDLLYVEPTGEPSPVAALRRDEPEEKDR
jgi:hypothetical protein